MSPNQYVSDLRAEVAALRAVVARVEELADELVYVGHALREALNPVQGSTDSDPAATERQGEAEGAGDGV